MARIRLHKQLLVAHISTLLTDITGLNQKFKEIHLCYLDRIFLISDDAKLFREMCQPKLFGEMCQLLVYA